MSIVFILLLLLATGCGVSFQEEAGTAPVSTVQPTVVVTNTPVATAIPTATQAPTATATKVPTPTVVATPAATATVTPTATATPSPTATPKPAVAAPAPQVAPTPVKESPGPPPPQLEPSYRETGKGLTQVWTLAVGADKVLIVGGYRVDGRGPGVYKAYPGGQTVTVTVTDGFATIVEAGFASQQFCFRVGQARQYGWDHSIVEPLPGWPAC